MRALFILVFLPIYYHAGIFEVPEGGLPVLGFAGSMAYFAVLFFMFRGFATNDFNTSTVRLFFWSLVTVPAFMLTAAIVRLLWIAVDFIFIANILPAIFLALAIFKLIGWRRQHDYNLNGHGACIWCGTKITGFSAYCSSGCKKTASEPTTAQCECEKCKRMFPLTRQQLKDNTRRFCNRNCYLWWRGPIKWSPSLPAAKSKPLFSKSAEQEMKEVHDWRENHKKNWGE
jgi:hypothetical protein